LRFVEKLLTSAMVALAVRRDSPNTQGTIGTFLTYERAVAAARDYVLRW
jgi:hypothetical protein